MRPKNEARIQTSLVDEIKPGEIRVEGIIVVSGVKILSVEVN